jgi:YegS/Rv2252/BmrU family lipid kinase
MRNALVILNPAAGNSDAGTIRRALEHHFSGQERTYEVYETTGQERVAEIVRPALERGFDIVVAAGGDGTVSGVAGGLVRTGVPLGIIPVGTGNALARDLGIPLDLEEALSLLTGEHTTMDIDAMQVGDQFFVLNAGIGISALAVRSTKRAHKRHFGRIAYIWAGLKEFFGFQPRCFTIMVDGERHQMRASEVMVLNSAGLGNPYVCWGPQIRLDDGRLDVRIVRAKTALDYLGLAWSMLLGQRKGHSHLRSLSAERSVTVNANRPLPVQADGDLISRTPVQIQVVPRAVRVIVSLAAKSNDTL